MSIILEAMKEVNAPWRWVQRGLIGLTTHVAHPTSSCHVRLGEARIRCFSQVQLGSGIDGSDKSHWRGWRYGFQSLVPGLRYVRHP